MNNMYTAAIAASILALAAPAAAFTIQNPIEVQSVLASQGHEETPGVVRIARGSGAPHIHIGRPLPTSMWVRQAAPPLRWENAVSALVMNSSNAVCPSFVARFARRIALATSDGSVTRSLQPPSSFARLA